MSLETLAYCFTITAGALTLVVTLAIATRLPLPFFGTWARGYAWAFTLEVVENVGSAIGHPLVYGQVESVLCGLVAWYLAKADRLLLGRPMPRWLAPVLAVGVAANVVLMQVGVPFGVAAMPSLTMQIVAATWLSVDLVRVRRQVPGARALGLPLLLHSAWDLSYPVTSSGPGRWVGFTVEGILLMALGAGVVVFMVEQTAVRARERHDREFAAIRERIAMLATLDRELAAHVPSLQGHVRRLAAVGQGVAPMWAEPLQGIRQHVDQLAEVAHQLSHGGADRAPREASP